MCRVSFILPVFNAEKSLDRCIESIINQTFIDWELICCDDCSIDNSLEVLKKWEKIDRRIKVLKNDVNSKAALTRNKCISIAKGEYIAQIDDDDYCHRDRIKRQVEFLESNSEYAFVGSDVSYFDENRIWKNSNQIKRPIKKDFLWNSTFINPSVTFRKSCLDYVGGYRVCKETRRSQDYDLYMRLYSEGFYGYNLKEILTYYYRGEQSYAKCKYIYRIDEMKIRYKNFKKLGLLPKYIVYVFKPLIVGIIPIKMLENIKR